MYGRPGAACHSGCRGSKVDPRPSRAIPLHQRASNITPAARATWPIPSGNEHLSHRWRPQLTCGIICLAPNIRFCIAGLLHQVHFDYSPWHSTVPKTTTPAPGAPNSTAPECQVSIADTDRSLCKLGVFYEVLPPLSALHRSGLHQCEPACRLVQSLLMWTYHALG